MKAIAARFDLPQFCLASQAVLGVSAQYFAPKPSLADVRRMIDASQATDYDHAKLSGNPPV